MTPDDARIFLKAPDDEDPKDAFEEQVFVIRQFILSKPTLLKTFQQKQQQLRRLEEAFQTLGGIVDDQVKFLPPIDVVPLSEPEWQLMQYHQKKNEIRQRIASTLSVSELIKLIECLIDLERILAEPFRNFAEWTEEMPVIGRDMDAMQLLRDIRAQAEKGLTSISQLWEKRADLPATMLLELKRLSLLQNYLYEK